MYIIEVDETNYPPDRPAYSWTCPMCDDFRAGDNLQLHFLVELAKHHLVSTHSVTSQFDFKVIKEEKRWYSKIVNIDLTLDTIWVKNQALSFSLEEALRHAFRGQNVVVINKSIINVRDIV